MAKKRVNTNSNNVKAVSYSPNQLKALSALVARAQLASHLGYSFGTDRDLYTALGYKRNLTFHDYNAFYTRNDIARAVVNNPVDASWRLHPVVSEIDARETAFESAWKDLITRLRLYQRFIRLDILTGIGEYGVLLLGLNDVKERKDFTKPVATNTELSLLYTQAFAENNAVIATLDNDPKSERYGKPETYTLTLGINGDSRTDTITVHHSRVIHVVENPLENDIYGAPRLECVYNRIQDLEKLAGGSAEMFWLGARPGYAAIADADAQFGDLDMDAMQTQLDEFDNNVRRWLQLKGMTIKDLSPQVSSPAEHVDVQLTLISAATKQPKRILIGSERGELASSQDERAWAYITEARRINYCEPVIMRPFIDKCTLYGVLPMPSSGKYNIDWPPLATPSAKEKAEVGRIKSTTLKEYVTIPTASGILPPEMFLEKFLDFTYDEIEQVKTFLGGDFPDFQKLVDSYGQRSEEVDENIDDPVTDTDNVDE